MEEIEDMLNVTNKAVELLKAVKMAQGASADAGIRIRQGDAGQDHGAMAVGLAIATEPVPSDEAFEQDGLRIFIEETLIEPLDGRTLDVREAGEGPELVLR
jgi:iron-sulfur cluster assembly protein